MHSGILQYGFPPYDGHLERVEKTLADYYPDRTRTAASPSAVHPGFPEEGQVTLRMNRSAQIRDYLAKGFAPQAIARILDCSLNAVHVARYYMKSPQRRGESKPRKAASASKPEAPTQPITVGTDDHLETLRANLPDGYDRHQGSPDVDWSRAIVWMRQNPPPHLRSARP